MLTVDSAIGHLRLSYWSALGFCLLLAPGCGGGGGGQVRNEKMSKASGVVTLNGKPLDTGIVNFSNPYNGFSASGNIELAGKFAITLIPAGDYRVSINPPMPKEAGDPTSTSEAAVSIPAKYQNAETSGFQATVPPEGVTNLKFEIP